MMGTWHVHWISQFAYIPEFLDTYQFVDVHSCTVAAFIADKCMTDKTFYHHHRHTHTQSKNVKEPSESLFNYYGTLG